VKKTLRVTSALVVGAAQGWGLLFSVPTTDGTYAIYIMLASSLEEAKAIAATDSHRQERFALKCSNGTRTALSAGQARHCRSRAHGSARITIPE
jgi:hypothetical protein